MILFLILTQNRKTNENNISVLIFLFSSQLLSQVYVNNATRFAEKDLVLEVLIEKKKNLLNSYPDKLTKTQKKQFKAELEKNDLADSICKFRSDQYRKAKEILLYGSGSILGLATGDESLEDNIAPTGSLGVNLMTARVSFDIYYSLNSKSTVNMDSLADFGAVMLNPNLAGQSFSASVAVGAFSWIGVQGDTKFSNQIWQTDSTTRINATPLTLRAGLYFKPFIMPEQSNKIDLVVAFLFAHRSIAGDFNNEVRTVDANHIIPRGYNGIDFMVNLYINSLQLFTQVSRIPVKDLDIPNFSGTQIMIGVNIAGKFLSL